MEKGVKTLVHPVGWKIALLSVAVPGVKTGDFF